jgi:hypothetical protein
LKSDQLFDVGCFGERHACIKKVYALF